MVYSVCGASAWVIGVAQCGPETCAAVCLAVLILYAVEVLGEHVVPPCWLACQDFLSLETSVQRWVSGLILIHSQDTAGTYSRVSQYRCCLCLP